MFFWLADLSASIPGFNVFRYVTTRTGAAMGTAIRLHLHEGAVSLLRAPLAAGGDAARATAGLPSLSEIFKEAKGHGFDIKALRQIIRIRAEDPNKRAEREAILDTYMTTLGMT